MNKRKSEKESWSYTSGWKGFVEQLSFQPGVETDGLMLADESDDNEHGELACMKW